MERVVACRKVTNDERFGGGRFDASGPCHPELGWNSHGLRRVVRLGDASVVRRVDGDLSGDDNLDQRYRLPLVAVRVRSAACGRGDLARLLALALGALYAFRLAGSLRRFGGGRGDE